MRAAADWQLEEVVNAWEDAFQSDLEHGVRSLNDKAAKELAAKYPKIFAFGEVLNSMRPQQETEQKSFRPPIGIEPDYIWKTKRLHELVLAASRYIEAGKGVNVTWFLEMHTLIGDLHIYHQQQQENNND
jgi:hypothetical protein